MKKYLMTLGSVIVAALSLTSCLGDHANDEQKYMTRFGTNESFNRVEDLQTGDVAITNGAMYQFNYNFTAGTVSIEVTSLNLSNGMVGLSFRIPTQELKLDAQKGFYYCTGTDIVPEGAESSYIFNNFSFRSIPNRGYDNASAPVYLLNYTINNRYRVLVISNDNLYFGTTKSTPAEGGETYSNTDGVCRIELDKDKMTARLTFTRLKVSNPAMAVSFYVKDLPFTVTPNGYSIQQSGVVTAYNGSNTAYEEIEVSDLNVSANIANGANVSFKFKDEEGKTFNIASPLEYLIYKEQASTPSTGK